ncbi:MAG: hypothetical protein R3250_03750, partial [Melioribacteraceae bacterium]|nr:hypothetical protein [Melioribacteraceae bacterium]
VNPAVIKTALGNDYSWVMRALRATDDFEVISRLRSDKGISALLSLASLNVARVAGRLFIDEMVEAGETYEYKITFLNYEGKIIDEQNREVTIENSLPIVPYSVSCDAGDSKIDIKWEYPDYRGDPKDIVVGFNIYRKITGDKFERLNKVLIMRQDDLKERTDLRVENNLRYSYYLTAVDCIGRESEPSRIVSAQPIDLTPPSFPQGLDLFEEDGYILLSWNMNLELDLSHYDIFRSLDVNTGYIKINDFPVSGEVSSYKDTTVYFGPTYYYQIKAVDLSGNESELSNIISGKPTDSSPPNSPYNVQVTIENNFIRLNWSAPEDKDLQGYYIYRRRSDLEFLRIVSLPLEKDSLTFVDKGYSEKGLWQGQSYFYGISAVDNFFNESEKSVVEIKIPDNEPPHAPVSSYATSTPNGLVEITWQPSMSLDLSKYRIYSKKANDTLSVIYEAPDSIFKYIDSNTVRGVEHSYLVVAVDESGNESENKELMTILPKDSYPPPAPNNVVVEMGAEGVTISWEAVNVSDLLGYNIYRSDIPTGTPVKLNSQPIKGTEYIDPRGSAGLFYKVSSLDTSGYENDSGQPVEAVKGN